MILRSIAHMYFNYFLASSRVGLEVMGGKGMREREVTLDVRDQRVREMVQLGSQQTSFSTHRCGSE